MPSGEVKQRKGKSTHNGETNDTLKACGREERKKDRTGMSEENIVAAGKSSNPCLFDLKTIVSFLSLAVSFLLAWLLLQQNARFKDVEEKYRHLHEKASDLLVLQEKFGAVSKKLEASEGNLKGVLFSLSQVSKLEHDIASLNSIVEAMQDDQHVSSQRLQSVNERFLNITEAWQGGLAMVTDDMSSLRSESRLVHGRISERVNEAESHLRSLTERLEEVEAGTKRNARVLERTEEEDANRVQKHLDWNTKQVTRLQEQLKALSRRKTELEEQLEETEPRVRECANQLPAVEEAVKAILRLAADLSGAERRFEELTLQVLGTEDSMLKALSEILQLRKALNELQLESSMMKVDNELEAVLEAVEELKEQSKVEPDAASDLTDEEVEYFQQLDVGGAVGDSKKNSFVKIGSDSADVHIIGVESEAVTD